MDVRKSEEIIIYSDSTEALYCIPCLVFSHEQTKPSKSAVNGKDRFKLVNMKWQRMYGKLPKHETQSISSGM